MTAALVVRACALAGALPAMLLGCGGGARGGDGNALALAQSIEARVSALEAEVEHLRSQVSAQAGSRSAEFSAAFAPPESTYQTMRFDLGTLALSIGEIKPFGTGSKVMLNVGNPTSSQIRAIKVRLNWGGKEMHTAEHIFERDIPPASWSTHWLPLPDVKPSDFSVLTVKYLGHGGVAMQR